MYSGEAAVNPVPRSFTSRSGLLEQEGGAEVDTVSLDVAYAAMNILLRDAYERTDELGALLGSMSLLEDGKPADPAVWDEWVQAIEKAKAGDYDIGLNLS